MCVWLWVFVTFWLSDGNGYTYLSILCVCRNISSEDYGIFVIFSLKLTLAMQIIGFTVRLSSTLLWIQIYRLGVSYVDTTGSREADYDLRNSFLSPATPAVARQPSDSDYILGGSIFDPAYYSSLFEGQENRCSHRVGYSSLARKQIPIWVFLDNFHVFVLDFFGKNFIYSLCLCVHAYLYLYKIWI